MRPDNPFLKDLPIPEPVTLPGISGESSVQPAAQERTLRTDKGVVVTTTLLDSEAYEILRAVNGDEFVESLCSSWVKFGPAMTPNKRAWMHKKALEVLERELSDGVDQPAPSSPLSFPPSSALPATSGKFRFVFDNLSQLLRERRDYERKAYFGSRPFRVCLSLNTHRSKHPGHISVTDGARYSQSVYYGRISPTGDWFPSSNFTPDVGQWLVRLLDMDEMRLYARAKAN